MILPSNPMKNDQVLPHLLYLLSSSTIDYSKLKNIFQKSIEMMESKKWVFPFLSKKKKKKKNINNNRILTL